MNRQTSISIFSVSAVSALNVMGITLIIGPMLAYFPTKTNAQIQILHTIPYLLLMVSSFSVGWLLHKFTSRKIILIVMLLLSFLGLINFFIKNYEILFVSRLLCGLGFGLLNPINMTTISRNFSNTEKAKIIGYSSAVTALTAFLLNIFGGYLVGFGYNYYFLIYILPIVSFGFILVYYPEISITDKSKINPIIIDTWILLMALLGFCYTVFLSAYNINISIHINHFFPNQPQLVGWATAMHPLSAICIGLFYEKINRISRGKAMFFSMILAAISFLMVSFLPTNLPILFLFGAFCGMALAGFGQSAMYVISTKYDHTRTASLVAFYGIFVGTGNLTAPILQSYFQIHMFNTDTQNAFFTSFVFIVIFSVFSYALMKKLKLKY